MSIIIDNLAQIIRDSVEEAGATQQDWETALTQAFELELVSEDSIIYDPTTGTVLGAPGTYLVSRSAAADWLSIDADEFDEQLVAEEYDAHLAAIEVGTPIGWLHA